MNDVPLVSKIIAYTIWALVIIIMIGFTIYLVKGF
jgi:hypothetical protein